MSETMKGEMSQAELQELYEREMGKMFTSLKKASEELPRITQELQEKVDALKSAGKLDVNILRHLISAIQQDAESVMWEGNLEHFSRLLDSMEE